MTEDDAAGATAQTGDVGAGVIDCHELLLQAQDGDDSSSRDVNAG